MALTGTDDAEYLWSLPRLNKPGQLIGPIRYLPGRLGCLRPDYSSPGVRERIEADMDFHESFYGDRNV